MMKCNQENYNSKNRSDNNCDCNGRRLAMKIKVEKPMMSMQKLSKPEQRMKNALREVLEEPSTPQLDA